MAMEKNGGQILYDQIQILISGQTPEDTINALLNSLGSAMCQSFATVEAAEAFIDRCGPKLKAGVREEWDIVHEQLARTHLVGGRA